MPRINLLPWREEERKKRQRDFLIATGGAFVAALLGVFLVVFAYTQRIDGQNQRNARLKTEIAALEKSIAEIDGLEAQRDRLLARMEIIERLQRSRPEIVHLFDEITRRLPEGVYLTSIRQTGSLIEVTGVAQSSTRVSALMRQMDSSDWLKDPNVVRVETTREGPSRQASFIVTVQQVQHSDDGEDRA